MDFVAIDVETANADMASICQIGIACFKNGVLTEEWQTLINPEDYFSDINIGIHGIDETDVMDSPKFVDIFEQLSRYLRGSICVCHTHFDRISLDRAFRKHGLPQMEINWLDSARVARRSWLQFANKGYGLAKVAEHIGYTFKHHDALEDAKAAGHILLAAVEVTGISVSEWGRRIRQPLVIDPEVEKNPDGLLLGEMICFTGSMSLVRKDAEAIALKCGCAIGSGVTQKNHTFGRR
ncbi:exonuclease domain-containing protein [Pseudomonas monsensis]